MTKRINISTDALWEQVVGYSRAVRVGNLVEVSGTIAAENGAVVGKGDPYAQARYILGKIEQVLKETGAELKDVVRTRMYVTDIRLWKEVGRAHGQYFGDIKPATSMVEVAQLIEPWYLVEIEAIAYIA